jgi:hypothetical protein
MTDLVGNDVLCKKIDMKDQNRINDNPGLTNLLVSSLPIEKAKSNRERPTK